MGAQIYQQKQEDTDAVYAMYDKHGHNRQYAGVGWFDRVNKTTLKMLHTVAVAVVRRDTIKYKAKTAGTPMKCFIAYGAGGCRWAKGG